MSSPEDPDLPLPSSSPPAPTSPNPGAGHWSSMPVQLSAPTARPDPLPASASQPFSSSSSSPSSETPLQYDIDDEKGPFASQEDAEELRSLITALQTRLDEQQTLLASQSETIAALTVKVDRVDELEAKVKVLEKSRNDDRSDGMKPLGTVVVAGTGIIKTRGERKRFGDTEKKTDGPQADKKKPYSRSPSTSPEIVFTAPPAPGISLNDLPLPVDTDCAPPIKPGRFGLSLSPSAPKKHKSHPGRYGFDYDSDGDTFPTCPSTSSSPPHYPRHQTTLSELAQQATNAVLDLPTPPATIRAVVESVAEVLEEMVREATERIVGFEGGKEVGGDEQTRGMVLQLRSDVIKNFGAVQASFMDHQNAIHHLSTALANSLTKLSELEDVADVLSAAHVKRVSSESVEGGLL